MSDQLKRILTIAGFIATTALMAVVIYSVFFASDEPITTITLPQEQPTVPADTFGGSSTIGSAGSTNIGTIDLSTGSEAGTDQGQNQINEVEATDRALGFVTKTTDLSRGPVAFTSTPSANSVSLYDTDDERFYRINNLGERQLLSPQRFSEVQEVTWNNTADKAIMEFPDSSNIYFNFKTQKQYTLPQSWTEFSFNESGEQIVFKEDNDNPEFRWLSIASPDGTAAQKVQFLGRNGDKVTATYSPNNQIVGHYIEADSEGRSILYFIGLNDENYRATFVEGYSIDSQWSPTGEQLVYSVHTGDNGYRPRLWIVDAQGDTIGDNRIDTGLNTWNDKCSFGDNSTLYCAVPQELPDGAGLAPAIADEIPDSIYKIDLKNGQKVKIADTDINASISSISVDKKTNTLFFTDKATGSLRKISL